MTPWLRCRSLKVNHSATATKKNLSANTSDFQRTWTTLIRVFVFSFLLDRLLQYEKLEESSGDSDLTASSDSEPESLRPEGSGVKR